MTHSVTHKHGRVSHSVTHKHER